MFLSGWVRAKFTSLLAYPQIVSILRVYNVPNTYSKNSVNEIPCTAKEKQAGLAFSMSTKLISLHSFYPKPLFWSAPYHSKMKHTVFTRFIAADGSKITGINAAVNQKNAVLIRGLKQKNSVQLCNIHHPDNDCPWAKRPDIRTQTYTYVACSRLWDSRFGEIENKGRTRK